MAVENHRPHMTGGRDIKPRYAHVGHYSPPTIIIHGARVDSLSDNYRRYLEGFFRKALNLTGTPIRIIFKAKTRV